MKAYFKTNPEQIGEILEIYTTETGQKRFSVQFEYGTLIDAAAADFEIIYENTTATN